MLKNKNFYKVQMALFICVVIMCALKIVVAPGVTLLDFIDGSSMEGENIEYKNLGVNPQVRVLIMTEKFKKEYHESLTITGSDMVISYGENYESEVTIQEINLTNTHEYFVNGKVKIQNGETNKLTIGNFERAYGNPSYYGEMEIYVHDNGLVIINELPLETYLKGVVPSEMPSSYHAEALKVQAICARSYAYNQMQTISYPDYDAHMNDSVAYQVYNNSEEADTTNKAILATAGEKLGFEDKVVTTYFFSTSSGYTTDVRAWGTQLSSNNAYLEGVEVAGHDGDYEKELPWYRWNIEVESDTLERILELNLSEKIGKLSKVEIMEQGTGDVVLEIKIIGSDNSVTVEGENAIRRAFGSDLYSITKNDGTNTTGMELLPSAFFTIEKSGDMYSINGGGLGHGIGMSQNGANEMAKTGMDYLEILNTFYQNTDIII